MTIEAIFFDDGGVMNDNHLRGQQWRSLIADYFAPKYGGEKENWMKANTYTMSFIMDELNEIMENDSEISHEYYINLEYKIWTEKMFEYMGLTPPPKDQHKKLNLDVDNWIIPQIRSAYPGIVECIKNLSKKFTLHTASNETSKMLDLYLTGMNVRNCFTFLFGPDLVKVMKGNNKTYYDKMFLYANINPEHAVVIDDNPAVLKQAEKTNATVIQSCLNGKEPEFENYFKETKELEAIIDALAN